MYAAHREKGLEILGVAFVKGGERGQAWLAKYMADKDMTWPNVMAGEEWFGKPLDAYDVSGLPFNVLLDREGRVVGMQLHGDDLEQAVARILRDRPPSPGK